MFDSLIPTFVLYQQPDSPYAELTREMLAFTDLPFTEISIDANNNGAPKILPALSIDGELVSGVGPVCRRISCIVGLHGSNPRDDCIVGSVASQILQLWEEIIICKPNPKNDEEKISYVLEMLASFVKGAHNGMYMIGQKLTWADILLVHFVKYFVRVVLRTDARLKNRYPRLALFSLVPRKEHNFFDLY